ncbi:hypothetical protein AZE42_03772 [Rhizopogon vesiculosus]|uniref:Uncharacterized protein n=1 Tax=Rhizopogon vesiculosus TaxID=180088 RepID=A0A1J8R7Q7_9AGAM|nr:hypothetical protein AZE42_03772 [Rhizopogon vesiculosus]
MHLGNSQILFYPHGDQSLTPVPASIKYIYAKLYSMELKSRLENAKVSWVVSHFA